jgi:hypothetical protein
VWCVSLLVLVLNDHVLKGASLLPGAVTGKLSDFAGLIVAPVLAVALVRARTPRARAACFAAIALPFVLMNLWPAVARAVEGVTAYARVGWRVWCDPTDLVALVALPIAWRIVSRARLPQAAPVLARSAAAVGALACIATSAPLPPSVLTAAYVTNETDQTVRLRARWVEADLDCSVVDDEPGRALSPELFGDGVSFELAPGDLLPLTREAAGQPELSGLPDDDMVRGDGPCDAALLQIEGFDEVIVYWNRAAPIRRVRAATDDPRGRLELRTRVGRTVLEQGTGVELIDPEPAIEPSTCDSDHGEAFEWSGDVPPGYYDVAHVESIPGGCMALDLERWSPPGQTGPSDELGAAPTAPQLPPDAFEAPEAPDPDAAFELPSVLPSERSDLPFVLPPPAEAGMPEPLMRTLFLCVPAWAQPFSPGDRIVVGVIGDAFVLSDLVLASAGERDDATSAPSQPARRLWIYSNTIDVRIARELETYARVRDCRGSRLSCGAYATATDLWVNDELLAPGDTTEVVRDGRRLTVGLGQAEHVAVASEACEPGRANIGLHINMVVLEAPEGS